MTEPPLPPAWPPPPPGGPQDIEILDVTCGAAIRFPNDRARNERLRSAFRRIRWQAPLRCWYLPGVRAGRCLEAWRATEYARHGFDPWAGAKARDAQEFDAPPPRRPLAPTPLRDLPEPPRMLLWSPTTGTFHPGRRLTMDEWMAAIDATREGVRTEDGARSYTGAHIAQEAKRQAYADVALRKVYTRTEAESVSDLVPLDAVPPIGTAIVKDGRPCVYVALGRIVTITPWHVGRYGADLLVHVGRKGRFVQWALQDEEPSAPRAHA
ncbi:hypothetical protein VQ02_34165 [Methylobacterium variabile]|jgi:hypothetical protein|uniref:Uncharacterized protein n=1 Tax=Methylobacterium variabile TaxID=298794 RepID=A0A0J6RYS6_9HYPH|nr:hypothetical protein [Methylobacterium variabile]KMO26499.1 hypothetical protein VQ02_34165 [Methylobacterium variabile]